MFRPREGLRDLGPQGEWQAWPMTLRGPRSFKELKVFSIAFRPMDSLDLKVFSIAFRPIDSLDLKDLNVLKDLIASVMTSSLSLNSLSMRLFNLLRIEISFRIEVCGFGES